MTSFNDGVLDVYRDKDIKTPFGAKVNARSVDDLEFVVRLAYKAQAIRDQDFTFAERHGMVLTMKVKTHLVPRVDAECRAVIGGNIYDISHIDRTTNEMYLYLEGGAPFGGRDPNADQAGAR